MKHHFASKIFTYYRKTKNINNLKLDLISERICLVFAFLYIYLYVYM